jgi:virulence factor Mce-like protein
MRRRGSASIAANPVLIGAATTLIVVVAVFLAYNANSGLPFVPSYELKAEVPNAANLVKGNDVRVGGARVGAVTGIEPVQHRDGAVTALLTMKLETAVKPLPVNSTVLIRPRSALGLKYVEITKGTSSKGLQDGATIPLRQARPTPVELDEVLNTFDDRTRAASRTNLNELGTALAGRGADLNRAIELANPLLLDLGPVMDNLSARPTRLRRFNDALTRTAGLLAPVAETQASLFRNLDTTFTALSSVARPYLQDSIAGAPEALDAATTSLRATRPFLANSEALFRELEPGAAALRGAAPVLADTLAIGTPTLRRSVALNERLQASFAALGRVSGDPLVLVGAKDLAETARVAAPTVAYLTPAQTVCNYVTLFFRNISSLLSVGGPQGTSQRFIIVGTVPGPNNEGQPSSAPANGPGPNYLRSNPYPNTASPGQPHECEAGNEPFLTGRQVIGNPPGTQSDTTERTGSGR